MKKYNTVLSILCEQAVSYSLHVNILLFYILYIIDCRNLNKSIHQEISPWLEECIYRSNLAFSIFLNMTLLKGYVYHGVYYSYAKKPQPVF